MPDRETVIKGLKKCRRCECDNCTEKGASKAPWDCPAYDDFIDSAIVLLKEQEAVEPKKESDGNPGKLASWWYVCGNCGDVIDWHDIYCRHCGREVKWNA